MALVTVDAVVDIPVYVLVMEIVRVIAVMATRALEYRIVVRVGVARRAHTVRVAVIYVEPGVVECGARPVRRLPCGVTRVARSGKARCLVVRIRRVVVIRHMAAGADRRQRRIVVVHVAQGAGYGRTGVGTQKRERRLRIVIKGRVGPRGGAVARIAGSR